MKNNQRLTGDASFTRRNFIKSGAGAIVAAGCLHGAHLNTSEVYAQTTTAIAKHGYICPPCGMPCDKLIFDKPGSCPQCGLILIPADGEGGPPRVAMLLYDGVEIIDMAGPWEVFGNAGLPIHTVAEKLEPVTLVFGQKTIPDYTFENSPKADVLWSPAADTNVQRRMRRR
jgi:hypothetical protein